MADLTKSIDTILRAIREERAFRNDLNSIATTITDKIYSYYTNPNCSCKSSITEWVNKNIDATNTLLEKHAEAIKAIDADVAKAAVIAKANPQPPQSPPDPAAMFKNPRNKMGHVFDIPRNPEEYKKLIQRAAVEQWMYRGTNVVPDIVDGNDVWTVFFY